MLSAEGKGEADDTNRDLINASCYIASSKTKRDWPIRGHVTLDKCNVSLRATSKKLLTGYEHKKTKWRRNLQF